jgi:hypothetical protein
MFDLPHPTDVQLAFIALVSVGSIARLGRLLVHDHWPPVSWLRSVWDRIVPERTDKDGWNLLLHCHYCLCVWLAFGVILWGYFTDWNLVWWLVNAPLAASYAAAILVTFDGDD